MKYLRKTRFYRAEISLCYHLKETCTVPISSYPLASPSSPLALPVPSLPIPQHKIPRQRVGRLSKLPRGGTEVPDGSSDEGGSGDIWLQEETRQVAGEVLGCDFDALESRISVADLSKLSCILKMSDRREIMREACGSTLSMSGAPCKINICGTSYLLVVVYHYVSRDFPYNALSNSSTPKAGGTMCYVRK